MKGVSRGLCDIDRLLWFLIETLYFPNKWLYLRLKHLNALHNLINEEAVLGHCFFLYRWKEKKRTTVSMERTYDCPMKSRISRKPEAMYIATVGGNMESKDPRVDWRIQS